MRLSPTSPFHARWPLLVAAGVVFLSACSSVPRDERTSAAGERSGHLRLNGSGPQSPPDGFPRFVDHSVGQEEISMQAMGLVGVPYRWGGNTPDAGFDCSGLVRYVVERAASVNLPRTTADMSREGVSIAPDAVAPGDLIFFNTTGRAHSHVGVYVGDYRFVNAPSTGGTVRIDYVTNPYWAKRFDGIRRVAGRGTAPVIDSPIAPPIPRQVAPALAAAPDPGRRAAPSSAAVYTAVAVPPGPVTTASPVASAPAASLTASGTSGADPIATAIMRAENGGPGTPDRAPGASTHAAEDDPIARIGARGY